MVQKSPIFTPGRAESGLIARDGEIARGHQLASGGSGDALHLRDHWLRDGLDLGHQLSADVEELAVIGDCAAHHFGQVVAGAEDFAGGRDDDGADVVVGRKFVQAADQFAHQFERQWIAAFRTI